MPIQIPNDLPAAEVLQNENIFVMKQTRAETQHIRPLEIVLLNLMPTKIVTETQLSRLLGKKVGTGEFGADMKVSLVNDGPVTICMDSKNKE